MIYHLKLQPSEIEALDYYEYWYYIKDIAEVLKKQNSENSDQTDQMTAQQKGMMSGMKMPNVNGMKGFGTGNSGMKMPKISIPKL